MFFPEHDGRPGQPDKWEEGTVRQIPYEMSNFYKLILKASEQPHDADNIAITSPATGYDMPAEQRQYNAGTG